MAPSRSPGLTRFLSDFTLGFSDGLTVPFALTAGLSSLGKADTVIYAGLAELCAGSISMGIGGYLAAVDELPTSEPNKTIATSGNDEEEEEEDDEEQGMLLRKTQDSSSESSSRASADEKSTSKEDEVILAHLAPLGLADTALSGILTSLREQPGGVGRAVRQIKATVEPLIMIAEPALPIWPVASGLSISLGYIIGGIIPLLPYFFASTVGIGLSWSIGLCLVALMAFGTGKSWLLGGRDKDWKACIWSGLQMLILGSLAAGAAVLCVNLLGAATSEHST